MQMAVPYGHMVHIIWHLLESRLPSMWLVSGHVKMGWPSLQKIKCSNISSVVFHNGIRRLDTGLFPMIALNISITVTEHVNCLVWLSSKFNLCANMECLKARALKHIWVLKFLVKAMMQIAWYCFALHLQSCYSSCSWLWQHYPWWARALRLTWECTEHGIVNCNGSPLNQPCEKTTGWK